MRAEVLGIRHTQNPSFGDICPRGFGSIGGFGAIAHTFLNTHFLTISLYELLIGGTGVGSHVHINPWRIPNTPKTLKTLFMGKIGGAV